MAYTTTSLTWAATRCEWCSYIPGLIQSLGRDISVMTMFEHPTISAMARHLSQGQDKGPSFEPILDRVEKRKAALQSQRQRRSGHAA